MNYLTQFLAAVTAIAASFGVGLVIVGFVCGAIPNWFQRKLGKR